MIKINVAEIKRRPVLEKTLDCALEPAELEIAPQELALIGSVQLEGSLSNVGDVLLLRARMHAKARRVCGRCLREFAGDLQAEVVEKFYPAGAENMEKDAFVYEADVADITQPLREGLLLAEPMQALCKPDCRGLCPVCGADLNDGECGCDRHCPDPRLAALRQFIKN